MACNSMQLHCQETEEATQRTYCQWTAGLHGIQYTGMDSTLRVHVYTGIDV